MSKGVTSSADVDERIIRYRKQMADVEAVLEQVRSGLLLLMPVLAEGERSFAESAIDAIDEALDFVSETRGHMGNLMPPEEDA